VEDVCYSESETQYYAQYSGPVEIQCQRLPLRSQIVLGAAQRWLLSLGHGCKHRAKVAFVKSFGRYLLSRNDMQRRPEKRKLSEN